MCLHKIGNRKKAKEDIVCYKVVEVLNNEYGEVFASLFHRHIWAVGGTYIAPRAKYFYGGDIKDGYFHTYKSINSLYGTTYFQESISKRVLLACVIPKGTYYYEGIHSDSREGYASKSLKVVMEIKPGTIEISNIGKYIQI